MVSSMILRKNQIFIIFCLLGIFILASFCIYQATKKEDIYISFEDLKGYKYQFIDSIDVLKTRKILIKHVVKFGIQFNWEIIIDTLSIKKDETNSFQNQIINSQFFIINNFGRHGKENDLLNNRKAKYRIYILKQEKEIQYILPVKEVALFVNHGGIE